MKQEHIYTCSHCGAQFQKWIGRCLECGKWGTLEQGTKDKEQKTKDAGYVAPKTIAIHDVQTTGTERMHSGVGELDRVFGGGIIPGSITLLGGEPGIGKSTLSLQLAAGIPNAVYISAEESIEQISLRAKRLRTASTTLRLGNETSVDAICAAIISQHPSLAIVDSIQTIASDDAVGEAGNVTQVRACTVKLLEAAEMSKTAIILIGHVAKDGTVAGPRTLEHLVDTVLYLEGDRHHDLRLLRGVKNRFGSTDEVGVFDMQETGLTEVNNPSAAFLQSRGDAISGSVVTCLLEGTRSMLVEIQALVNKTAFGYPARKASGFDLNRLHVLIAVLEKRAGLALGQYDVHVNVVGGIRANEPAADLAVCLAIASAYKEKILGNDLVCFGEVGLGGEIRPVRHTEKRVKECVNLGMKKIILPKGKSPYSVPNATVVSVKNIQELILHT